MKFVFDWSLNDMLCIVDITATKHVKLCTNKLYSNFSAATSAGIFHVLWWILGPYTSLAGQCWIMIPCHRQCDYTWQKKQQYSASKQNLWERKNRTIAARIAISIQQHAWEWGNASRLASSINNKRIGLGISCSVNKKWLTVILAYTLSTVTDSVN